MSEDADNNKQLAVIEPRALALRQQAANALEKKARFRMVASAFVCCACTLPVTAGIVMAANVFSSPHSLSWLFSGLSIAVPSVFGMVRGAMGANKYEELIDEAKYERTKMLDEKKERCWIAVNEVLDRAIADCKATPGEEFLVSPPCDTPKLLVIDSEENTMRNTKDGTIFQNTLHATLYEAEIGRDGRIEKRGYSRSFSRQTQPAFSLLKPQPSSARGPT